MKKLIFIFFACVAIISFAGVGETKDLDCEKENVSQFKSIIESRDKLKECEISLSENNITLGKCFEKLGKCRKTSAVCQADSAIYQSQLESILYDLNLLLDLDKITNKDIQYIIESVELALEAYHE